ncbi:hypothetical protein D3C75_1383420 [compost metagenome]
MFERSIGQHVPCLADRTIGHDRHPVCLAPGQEIEFYAALLQVIEHLIGGAVFV